MPDDDLSPRASPAAPAAPSTPPPGEATDPHSRLLRCSLCVEESRSYWAHVDPTDPRGSAATAFVDSWFGTKSEAWTTELLSNMRVRFDPFPAALDVLSRWRAMPPDVRRLVCHFHLQLTDPLYRAFTGTFLAERRDALRADVHRQSVNQWVADHGPPRWALKTRLQFASRLLSCALAAGLLRGKRDPREAVAPRVPDDALAYLLYVLRHLDFQGSLVRNPYLSSLGLVGGHLADRLRALHALEFRQIGDAHEIEWRYPDVTAWADAELPLVAAHASHPGSGPAAPSAPPATTGATTGDTATTSGREATHP
ncbi:MAG: DUF1819 domain-containing protein [Myxococcales bacterium]|nr:DUF1819 domain-containing protein [Myxococcales bacterium]